jgi:hypothetical protein
MARRVGRPSKPWVQVNYTESEIVFMLALVRKTDNKELKIKLSNDIKERKRLHKNYEKAKQRLFKQHGYTENK